LSIAGLPPAIARRKALTLAGWYAPDGRRSHAARRPRSAVALRRRRQLDQGALRARKEHATAVTRLNCASLRQVTPSFTHAHARASSVTSRSAVASSGRPRAREQSRGAPGGRTSAHLRWSNSHGSAARVRGSASTSMRPWTRRSPRPPGSQAGSHRTPQTAPLSQNSGAGEPSD
jgi:hypothetical protein